MKVYEKLKSESISLKQNLFPTFDNSVKHKSGQSALRVGIGIAALIILLSGILFTRILAQNASAVPVYKYYTCIPVEKGDTLWSIAEEYLPEGTDKDIVEYIDKVKELNHLSDDKIIEGSKLLVFYYSTEYK